MLNKVTITGADDKVDIQALIDLQLEFPFVEWGILLSKSKIGTQRYPSAEWLTKLQESKDKLILSGHICGGWKQAILDGFWTIVRDLQPIEGLFNRIQINCHGQFPKHHHDFTQGLDSILRSGVLKKSFEAFILPWNGKSQNRLLDIVNAAGIVAYPLFDVSGGRGTLDENWPTAKGYTGYAGGLGPENIQEQLSKIEKSADQHDFWVDSESRVRTENDFDLAKVRDFLKICSGQAEMK